jgi:hypothetical protein
LAFEFSSNHRTDVNLLLIGEGRGLSLPNSCRLKYFDGMKMMFGFYDGCMDSGSMDDMSI